MDCWEPARHPVMIVLFLLIGVVSFVVFQRIKSKRPPAPQYFATPPNKHAIVIGGGISGLLSAGVLSKHFEKVTLFDRDAISENSPKPRNVFKDACNVKRRSEACETILPGVLRDVLAAGGTTMHYGEIGFFWKKIWLTRTPRSPATDPGLTILAASRPHWEHVLSNRVRALPNVTIVPSTLVSSLIERNGSIVGVRLATEGNSIVEADFVVDASGRQSKIDTWLQEIGYDPIPIEECDAGVGYMTGVFEMPEGATEIAPGTKGMLIVPTDDKTRIALAWPIENRQYQLTFACYGKDYPPSDRQQLEAWIESLPHPETYLRILREWNCIQPFVSIHLTPSRLRRIERVKRWPNNLVCTGDVVASLNPIFAQGMTQAALHAVALDQVLHEQHRDYFSEGWWWVPQEFHSRAARIAKNFWNLGTPDDLARASSIGERTMATRFGKIVNDNLLELLFATPEGAVKFAHLQQCLCPPEKVLLSSDVIIPMLIRLIKHLIK